MMDIYTIAEHIKTKISFSPKIGIVLGTGLGGLCEAIESKTSISYKDIPGFPTSTVEGHKGEYIFGYLNEVPVVLMNGRVHHYEGYPMSQVVIPVQVMALLGVETIIITNASGGLNRNYSPGTIMCINDQISMFVPNPLIGPNDDRLGTRFPEMSQIYDRELIQKLHKVAEEEGIAVEDGVYVQVTGPSFESPAESRMLAALGADAVGMSTACEAMVLNYMGIKVLGISCITDMAIDNEDLQVTHEEVQAVAAKASQDIIRLVGKTATVL